MDMSLIGDWPVPELDEVEGSGNNGSNSSRMM